MDDGLLGSGHVLGLAGHPHGLVGALAPPPPPPMKQPQMDIPSGKKQLQQLKGASSAASTFEYHYQFMCAHLEREREHLPHTHPLSHQHRAVLVAHPHGPHHHPPPTLNSASAFRPWGPTNSKAFLHAYNATLSSLPYACQEPPELQNPERVVRSTDKRYAERTYQPNVALAPRKSILSKERDKDREQLVVPRMGRGWRSFATTSLWLLIFMILLFNGSFVGLHCEREYVSGFQFSYRRVNIFPSSSNVCLILFYIFCSLPSSPVWGHVCRPNLPPWSVAFSIYLSICGLPFFGANLLTQDDGQQVSWLQTFAAYFEDARREAENENW